MSAHFLSVIAEWAATVGVLVYAYEWGGAGATGVASIAVLAPSILGAPATALLTDRIRPGRLRRLGFAVQLVAFAAAALAAALGATAPLVVGLVVVGIGGLNTLRPTGAVLLPAVARSSRELTSGGLWTGHAESASALVGPLLAGAFLALGGPQAVLGACAVAALFSIGLSSLGADAGPAARPTHPSTGATAALRATIAEFRARPASLGLVGVASARNVVLGAFDVLLVITAITALDLGRGGPGLLNALVGGGALASTFVSTMVVRRSRLRPALTAALTTTAVLCVALGVVVERPVYLLALPLVGVCLSLMDNLSRMLLQRSTDPASLGSLFSFLGLLTGVGQLVGSGIAQLLVAVGGIELALQGLAVCLVAILLLTARSLGYADRHADVPVVEMSLLRRMPMFGPLPPIALEAVARAARTIDVTGPTTVITQGETGDAFFGVVDGEFDVVMSGELIRTAHRGDFFGEVALLADVARTATITSRGPGRLLEIHRHPFLVAVTGHDHAYEAATGVVRGLRLDTELPEFSTGVPPDGRPLEPGTSGNG